MLSALSPKRTNSRHLRMSALCGEFNESLSRFSQAYLNRIALRLNQRPRKTLGFETPADRLRAVLQ